MFSCILLGGWTGLFSSTDGRTVVADVEQTDSAERCWVCLRMSMYRRGRLVAKDGGWVERGKSAVNVDWATAHWRFSSNPCPLT